VGEEEWLQRCICPGAAFRKEIHVQVHEEGEQRRALTKEALDEVRSLNLNGHKEILEAFEDAYERRGLELSEVERQILVDAIEASRVPRPRRDLEGLKLLGRLGITLIRETKRALVHDKAVDPVEKHYDDVVDLARSLGDERREDQGAVSELQAVAGPGGTHLLERAAQWFAANDGSFMDEFDNWDRSYRLLRAAAAGGTVEPVPTDRARFFDEVIRLENDPTQESWVRLVGLQPALSHLEAEVQSAAPVEASVDDRIRLLVGPTAAEVPNPILRTITARNVIEKHLGNVYKYTRPAPPS
jgi:hypothetical protein